MYVLIMIIPIDVELNYEVRKFMKIVFSVSNTNA